MDKQRQKKRQSNYLVQGTILAMAGIIVRLIGLLYKIPMTRALGDEGIGYYNTAYEIYNIGLILSSYSLPLAVSKLIARKEEEGAKGDAHRVFRCGLLIGGVMGGAMTVFLLLGAGRIAGTVFNSPGSALPLRVMTPTIFVFSVMGVIRGYFQGHGDMVPTSVSQIIEQIVNALVSVIASWQFMRIFADRDNPASYGAAGGTLGTLTGACAAFLFLLALMAMERENNKEKFSVRAKSSYGTLLKLLILTFIPIILSQFVYQLSGSVDNSMFGIIMGAKGYSERERASFLGMYGGKYRLLTNVPVAIASSLGASMIPSIVSSRVHGREDEVRSKVYMTIKFNMMIAIPCAFGMFFLAGPVMRLVFGDARETTANLLRLGASAVVFFSLSTVTNAVLQGIDLMRKSVTHSAISLAIHVILVYGMLKKLDLGVYGLVIGNVTFALVVCALNWIAVGKTLHYRQEVKTTFCLPALASLIMGVFAWLCYHGIYAAISSNAIAVLLAAALGAALYAVLLILLRAVTKEELRSMPFGGILIRLMRVLHQ